MLEYSFYIDHARCGIYYGFSLYNEEHLVMLRKLYNEWNATETGDRETAQNWWGGKTEIHIVPIPIEIT